MIQLLVFVHKVHVLGLYLVTEATQRSFLRLLVGEEWAFATLTFVGTTQDGTSQGISRIELLLP